jgi:hypothetical protein
MQRPIGVTITAILMVVNIFWDVLLSLLSPNVVVPNTSPHGPAFSPFVIALHIALVTFVVVQCVVVLFYWLGRSWTRWFVLVGCIFYLVGLKDLVPQWHRHHSYPDAALTLGSATLAVYLLWYLHTRDVRDWFARATIAASTPSAARAPIDK